MLLSWHLISALSTVIQVGSVNQGRTGLEGRPQFSSRASLLGAEGQKGSPASSGFERRKTYNNHVSANNT